MTGLPRKIGYLLFVVGCIPLCLEVALRIMGYHSFVSHPFTISSDPPGCLLPHPRLGFALQPGAFRVGINNHVWYQATHGSDSFRVSSFIPADTARQVWLLGCSFTYGMGVDDSATCAWRLQHHLPDTWIRNMGIPGHGTVHAWLRIQDQLARGDTPAVAVIMFTALHMERNVLSPFFRYSISQKFGSAAPEHEKPMLIARMPYIRSDTLAFEPWDNLYRHWPGREYFATVQYLQQQYDLRWKASLDPRGVTLKLFHEISQICQMNDIPLLVAGISADNTTQSVLCQLQREGIKVVRTNVNLEDPVMTHAPYDSHPSALAHQIYADSLLPALETLLH